MPREPVNEPFYWNEKPGTTFVNELNNAYDKIVYPIKNLFLLPTGAAGKSFINEMTRMIKAGIYDTPIKAIALHVMPALLLQKPSKNSKSKDHLKSLERRFEIWKEENINKLYEDGKAIQDRLKSDGSPNDIVKISKKFKLQIQKENDNGAFKIVTNNMNGGILPLTDETFQLLELKHPDAKNNSQQTLLPGPIQKMHPILYDDIDEELMKKAAIRTKGGS